MKRGFNEKKVYPSEESTQYTRYTHTKEGMKRRINNYKPLLQKQKEMTNNTTSID